MRMSSAEKIPMRTKLAFGVGSVGEGTMYVAFNTWNMLFYNQVLGLPASLAGLAATVGLVLDACLEPVIATMSDRWRSGLGRRHPFIYASAIPLALSMYCMYSPPA